MKKLLALLIAIIMVMGLVACGGDKKEDTAKEDSKKAEDVKEEAADDKKEEAADDKKEEAADDKKEEAADDKKEEAVDEADLPVLRLGVFDSRSSFVNWYIMENGLDVANGFKIEPTVSTAGGSFLNEAIGAGKIDATQIAAAQAVFSASVYDCINVVEFSEASGSSAIFARPDSDEAQIIGDNPDFPEVRGSAETIKGKTFMYPTGSMSQLTVAKYLEVFGLTLDDIDSINTQYGPGYQALQAGEGDTVTLFSPLTLFAESDGYVALASMDQLGQSVRDCLMVTPEAYNNPEKMDTIKKWITVLFECNEKFQEDKEWQREELEKFHAFYGNDISDPAMLDTEINKHYLLTVDEAMASLDDLGKSALAVGTYYYEIGIVEEDALEKIENNVDKSIMQELYGDK
ncbi:MAG: hypothetical protein ACOX3H_01460 [Saccharofermentanales bacterium]|jgi:sulfonate transport system substrate-binding protein